MSLLQLLWLTFGAVFLTCLGLVALLVATKVLRTRHERRAAELVQHHRLHLVAVAAGEDDDGSHLRALEAVDGEAREPLDDVVIDLLTKVRGAPAEALASLLLAHGVADRAPHDLRHRNPVRRARAASALGLCDVGSALPLLVEALKDHSPQVRVAATSALGRIGQPSAARPILAAVGAEDAVPAGPAADALERMGVGVSPALAEGLGADSATTRTVAAYVSGEGAFSRSVPGLREALAADPDLTVRETAATALGKVGRSDDVLFLLRYAAADQPLSLRRSAVAALAELGDASSIDAMAGLAADDDPRVAETAAEALLRLGAPGRAALDQVPPSPAVETARLVAAMRRGTPE